MRTILLLFVSLLLLAACSAPKYSYYFDHYDYNSGKKKSNPNTQLANNPMEATEVSAAVSPLFIPEETLVASAENPIIVPEKKAAPVIDQNTFQKKYLSMTKSEKKAFRNELKNEVKKYLKSKKTDDNGASVENTKVMDYNLKMALIFGSVGVVLSILGGVNEVFWILSVVAIVIGLVFFIKWLAEQ